MEKLFILLKLDIHSRCLAFLVRSIKTYTSIESETNINDLSSHNFPLFFKDIVILYNNHKDVVSMSKVHIYIS